MAGVRTWLEEIGLPQYADSFERNAINGALLPALTDADLKEIGVGPLGHREQLLAVIAGLRIDEAAAADAARSLGPPAAQRLNPAERCQLTVLFCDLSGSTQSEVLRVKGLCSVAQDDLAGAEGHYVHSLDVARSQDAKLWELRTATSYAALLMAQRTVAPKAVRCFSRSATGSPKVSIPRT